MSSSNEELSDPEVVQKRRKSQRTCDSCKQKKRRCDGPQNSGEKCSNCIAQGLECTYQMRQKKRGRRIGFVETMESRIKLLEGLVKKLCPDLSVLHSYIYPHDPEYAEKLTKISVPPQSSANGAPSDVVASVAKSNPDTDITTLLHKLVSLTLGSQEDPFRKPGCGARCNVFFEQIKSISIDFREERYWGASSGVSLMREISVLKKSDATTLSNQPHTHQVQGRNIKLRKRLTLEGCSKPKTVEYTYPPPDLIDKLTNLYFEHVNLFYPLLHMPSFQRQVADHLHLRDVGFGGVLLLVCAVGSRYLDTIDDTLPKPGDNSFMAGWMWYKQVHVVKPNMIEDQPPTLYDLQMCCLAAEYLFGSCGLQTVWLLTGYGIRLAQDVGAHRRIVSQDRLTVEDELWKRAFWVLISKDRSMSVALGRPCAIFDNHFDVDLPVECDDEHWENEDPALRFKQPDGVPCTVTAFNRHLQLSKVMSFAMNSVFSVRSNIWELISEGWEYQLVSEIDSELNNWLHALPDHLRWDPNRPDSKYLKLSGSLILFYHHVQILIHRPYIRAEDKPKSLAFPALAICNSAARSTAVVLDHLNKRYTVVYPFMQMSCGSVMVVLLINVLGETRRKGKGKRILEGGKNRDVKYLRMAIDVFRKAEGMSYCAGPVSDIFSDFVSAFNNPGESSAPASMVDNATETSQAAPSVQLASIQNGDLPHGLVPQDSSNAQPTQFSGYDSSLAPTYLPPSEVSNFSGAFDSGFQPLHLGDYMHDTNSIPLSQLSFSDPGNIFNTGQISSTEHYDTTLSHIPPASTTVDQPANNTMELWFNAPEGFDINQWGTFLSNFMEATDGAVGAGFNTNLDS